MPERKNLIYSLLYRTPASIGWLKMGSFTSHSQVSPSSKLLCNRKWTSCANGLFCRLEGESEAITHSKLRPLADIFAFFSIDLCSLPVDPTCRRHADPTVKCCFFCRESKNTAGGRWLQTGAFRLNYHSQRRFLCFPLWFMEAGTRCGVETFTGLLSDMTYRNS